VIFIIARLLLTRVTASSAVRAAQSFSSFHCRIVYECRDDRGEDGRMRGWRSAGETFINPLSPTCAHTVDVHASPFHILATASLLPPQPRMRMRVLHPSSPLDTRPSLTVQTWEPFDWHSRTRYYFYTAWYHRIGSWRQRRMHARSRLEQSISSGEQFSTPFLTPSSLSFRWRLTGLDWSNAPSRTGLNATSRIGFIKSTFQFVFGTVSIFRHC
jgi:hypothetical protein